MNLSKKLILLILLISAGQLYASAGRGRMNTLENREAVSPDSKEVIIKALKNFEALASWSAELINFNDSTGNEIKLSLKYCAPDSFATSVVYFGKKMEIITIEQDVYSNFDGKWEKSRRLPKTVEDFIDELSNRANETLIKNASLVGKEKINGVETTIYQYELDAGEFIRQLENKMNVKTPDSFEDIKVKIWITPDLLPAKTEFVRKAEGLKSEIVTIRKTTTYKFDEKVTIQAPKI